VSGFLSLPNGNQIPVRNGLKIGRGADCDVVLHDTKSSRHHARLVVEGGVVEIEDLGSSNGTLLNGKQVTRRLLRAGDKVQIGMTVLTFGEGRPAPGPDAPGAAPPAKAAAAADEDVDLFGAEGSVPAPTREASPSPSPQPPTLTTAPPLRVAPTKPARTASPVPPPVPQKAPPPSAEVVEFADEVVELREPARPEPAIAARASAPAAAATVLDQKQRVLQFHKRAGKGGPLGDDLSQMSSGVRAVVFLAVLGGAVLLAWLAMQVAR
jgi:predicted component of type VI protein secretion system